MFRRNGLPGFAVLMMGLILAGSLLACGQGTTSSGNIQPADIDATLAEFSGERDAFVTELSALRATGVESPSDRQPTGALPELMLDERLARAAAIHALDMAQHRFFDHIGSDGNALRHRLAAEGFTGTVVHEEFWATSGLPEDLAGAALRSFATGMGETISPLFHADARRIGVAFARTESGGHVGVVIVAD